MNDEMDGKKVKAIYWPDGANETGRELCAKDGRELVYRHQYLGDHSECWVVMIEDGKEVARHNTRFVESIVWAAE